MVKLSNEALNQNKSINLGIEQFLETYGKLPVLASDDYLLNEKCKAIGNIVLIPKNSPTHHLLRSELQGVESIIPRPKQNKVIPFPKSVDEAYNWIKQSNNKKADDYEPEEKEENIKITEQQPLVVEQITTVKSEKYQPQIKQKALDNVIPFPVSYKPVTLPQSQSIMPVNYSQVKSPLEARIFQNNNYCSSSLYSMNQQRRPIYYVRRINTRYYR